MFYEGHLPGFSFNTLVKKALGRPGIDEGLERLFARGIDPESGAPRQRTHEPRDGLRARPCGPSPTRRIERASTRSSMPTSIDPATRCSIAPKRCSPLLEHEAMHQETLLYMWHRLPFDQKRRPAGYMPMATGRPPVAMG